VASLVRRGEVEREGAPTVPEIGERRLTSGTMLL
jgi:hypothetical protein